MAAARKPDPPSNLLAWSGLALALLALLYGCWRTWPRTVDDAYITFRYARALVDGAGPVFNPGERVEGCSSPAWMALSAAAIEAGLDPVPVSKVAGVLASIGLVVAVFVGLRRFEVVPLGAALGALLVGTSLVVQMWATAGLETNAYALAFLLGLLLLATGREDPTTASWASVSLVSAALLRPEGIAFWGLGLAVVAVRAGATRERIRSSVAYALPGVVLAGFFAWRLAYYGQLLPNTYYAKTGGGLELWKQGLVGLRLFAGSPEHLPWILAALVGTAMGFRARGTRTATAIVACAVAIHTLWVVSVGDDGLRVHRFHVPVLAPMAFLAGTGFRAGWLARRPTRPLGWAAAALAVTAALLSMKALSAEVARTSEGAALAYQEGNERLGRLLGTAFPSKTRIAVAAAGAIPYFSGLPTIDMYGLNDPHIAREPFPATRGGRLMKWDNDYVLARRPDVIVINRGYFRAGDPMAAQAAKDPRLLADGPMDRDLFLHVARDGGYALKAIPFSDGAVFYVFERVGESRAASLPR